MSLSFRKTTVCFLWLLGLCLNFFISSPSKALEGGTIADSSQYPGLVILSYSGDNNFLNSKNCTGIVLEQRRILTSLSCVYSLGNGGFIPIPATSIYVHPVVNGVTGGNLFQPPVTPTNVQNLRVSSYAIHPQSSNGSGPYNLAILYLSGNINLPAARIYNGSNFFIGQSATALGWKNEKRPDQFLTANYYVLSYLTFPIVNSNTNIGSLCYDNFVNTNTVFCGGFRNSIRFLEFFQDEGSPIFRTIKGEKTVLGVLDSASHGLLFDGVFHFEKYARVSTMVNFIKQHAPDTIFRNENSLAPKPQVNIVPFLQQTLLNDD